MEKAKGKRGRGEEPAANGSLCPLTLSLPPSAGAATAAQPPLTVTRFVRAVAAGA